MILSDAMLFEWLAAQHGEEKLDTVAKIIEKGWPTRSPPAPPSATW
ncbi:hypothetical protein [Streptomyces cyaneogriseus]|nr:hypothetical protein [Streptomyces cyaneogriseus]